MPKEEVPQPPPKEGKGARRSHSLAGKTLATAQRVGSTNRRHAETRTWLPSSTPTHGAQGNHVNVNATQGGITMR